MTEGGRAPEHVSFLTPPVPKTCVSGHSVVCEGQQDRVAGPRDLSASLESEAWGRSGFWCPGMTPAEDSGHAVGREGIL